MSDTNTDIEAKERLMRELEILWDIYEETRDNMGKMWRSIHLLERELGLKEYRMTGQMFE